MGGWSGGWHAGHTNQMMSSRASEFQEMTPYQGRAGGSSGTAGAASTAGGTASTPRIIVKGVCLVGVFLERDEGVERLGGEPTRTLALQKMHEKASNFFSHLLSDSGKLLLTGPNLWHSDR